MTHWEGDSKHSFVSGDKDGRDNVKDNLPQMWRNGGLAVNLDGLVRDLANLWNINRFTGCDVPFPK